MIPLPADSWLWIVDDELVRTLFETSPAHPGLAARATAEPALVDAVRHWLRGEPAAALAALEPAVARDNTDALLLAAQLSFESGDPARAAHLYHRLAELIPDHPYAAFNEGLCLTRMRQWQLAAEALQRAVVLTPSHPEAWYLLGVALLHLERAAESASAFSQCLSQRSGYVPAVFGKAVALQLQGKHAEALELYLALLESAPQKEELLLSALRAALDAAEWPQVRQLAVRIFALRPGFLPAREALAHADLAEGKYEEALAAFRQLASAAPALLEPWYHAGLCEFRLGRYAEAAESFRSALLVDARHEESRLALAESLRLAGRLGEAREALEGLLEAAPSCMRGWLRLGLLEAEADRLEEARRALEQALQLGAPPEDEDLAGLRAAVAALLQERGEYGPAAELYRLALAVQPEDASLLFNYGSTLASLERLEEAQQAWKKALALDPGLAPALIEALEPRPVRLQNGAASSGASH
ncbi:MAG: tetratricopeptide repeat protein [Bryobacteraceae bacterium]